MSAPGGRALQHPSVTEPRDDERVVGHMACSWKAAVAAGITQVLNRAR
ncbi:hypothetical protein ACFPOI_52535 [Nonomuraea angiospora]|uniref:Uncharacterized protein n=1 Tax=Nonomuraea angiospora TaxID=46172 RepID=A0ABR9M5P0_9ACTN|nr:hypothetical protein [Nonomuraea angiospora]MBE1588228.1 hypothetical protein [Nonomuraea angiospora]